MNDAAGVLRSEYKGEKIARAVTVRQLQALGDSKLERGLGARRENALPKALTKAHTQCRGDRGGSQEPDSRRSSHRAPGFAGNAANPDNSAAHIGPAIVCFRGAARSRNLRWIYPWSCRVSPLPYLPSLIFLMCPLMRLFMHKGHGTHGHGNHKHHSVEEAYHRGQEEGRKESTQGT